MKMNSVTDMDFIRKTAQASQAGVKIRADRQRNLLYPAGSSGKDR